MQRQLWLGILLTLVFWAIRVIAIEAFPPFVDEAFHINFARNVVERGPLAHASEGRQLVVWLYALSGSYHQAPFFTARVVTLLTIVPGFAAALAIGRLAGGWRGLLFVGLLYLASNYHLFFERLALADPVSASLITIAVYFAYRLTRRVSDRDAVLCGVLLFAGISAKILALPYLIVPAAAVLFLPAANVPWRARLRWLALALGPALILTLSYVLVLRWRGEDVFFYLLRGTGSGDDLLALLLTRIPNNIGTMLANLSGFAGPVGLALLAVALVLLIAKRRFFLPVLIILPVMIYWLNNRADTRHYAIPMTLAVVAAALVLADLTRERRVFLGAMGLVTALTLFNALPFAFTAARQPLDLPLPPADHAQYLTLEGSGTGLRAAIDLLSEHDPEQVYGLLANCLSLEFLTLDSLPVTCPPINPNGATLPALADLLRTDHPPGTYAIVEAIDYIPPVPPGEPLAVIARPGGPDLTIIALSSGD